MAAPKLRVTLVGSEEDQGEVLFGDFRDFCGTLALCLRKVEEIVAPEPGLRYRLTGLHSGSASLELVPVPPKKGPDPSEAVYKLFVETVKGLQYGARVEPRLGT